MSLSRRTLLASAASLTAITPLASDAAVDVSAAAQPHLSAGDFGVRANLAIDQTALLQKALEAAQASGMALFLPAGTYRIGSLNVSSHGRMFGAGAATRLLISRDGAGVVVSGASSSLCDLSIQGDRKTARGSALVTARDAVDLVLQRLHLSGHAGNGVLLTRCSGQITNCHVAEIGRTAIRALDSIGLLISQNTIHSIDNNGIQVWRSEQGEDATQVLANRITQIRAKAGGDGQNGNGINVFRAGNVTVANNTISDCAFSAVRGNAASNLQITGNTCARLGEVALYAEFGFQGAVISNNIVEDAAMGISVTNSSEGGRLAVVQGNLIRNLFRRIHPEDIRGTGIGVEADTVVQGNVIENAPTLGIKIGWGRYVRNVAATGNMIRDARIGIGVSGDPAGGPVSLHGNMIVGAQAGGIRLMDHNAVLDAQIDDKENLNATGNSVV